MQNLNNQETSQEGKFERKESQFRGSISPEEALLGRFHLYVSYACPWAHRTLITRNLKKLQKVISYSVTNPFMGEKGWSFSSGQDMEYLSDVYKDADANYSGKITVPVLWDNRLETIVNNESSEILRILNSSFSSVSDSKIDLYPVAKRELINSVNDKIYESVNNGVYKAGFASTQKAYEEAFDELFKTLDEMDELLGKQKYLAGEYLTEADIRFFTTLVRFDPVYFVHFKCNLKLMKEYKNLYPYLCSLYQIPEFRETCHFDHIKEHYYTSHRFLNPSGIIPKGPELDLEASHGRGGAVFFEGVRSDHLS